MANNSFKFTAATLALLGSVAIVSAEELNFPAAERDFSQNLAKTLKTEAANRLYNKAFRNYIEICGGSQWQKRGAVPGGNYGHGFLLLHGACRIEDPVTRIPQLKACAGQTVGISTDSNFNNVQWSAVQTREMALYGDLNPSSPLDPATYDRMLQRAGADGFLNGVKFRSDSTEVKNELLSGLDYTAGTEFAIAVPRNVNCTRLPLVGTKPGQEDGPLEAVITYLNKLNQEAYQSSVAPGSQGKPPFGFDYDAQVNNCAHTPYNTLSALGFWHAKNTKGHPDFVLDQVARAGDLVVPFNSLVEAFERGNVSDLGQIISWLNENPTALKLLKDYGWLSSQAGVIVEDIPPHNYMNSIFDPTVRRQFYSFFGQFLWYLAQKVPVLSMLPDVDLSPLSRKLNAMVQQPDSPGINLRKNLELWRDRYDALLKDSRLLNQSETAAALRQHFEAKYKETVDLLAALPRLEQETAREPGPQFAL